jgi:hypothetical protein
VPEPKTPRTKLPAKSFWYTGRSLTARRNAFNAFSLPRFKEAKNDFANWTMPQRPIAHGGMSRAQLVDLIAAMEGKITWAEYFRKWGSHGPSL